jgi:hypothetical protein
MRYVRCNAAMPDLTLARGDLFRANVTPAIFFRHTYSGGPRMAEESAIRRQIRNSTLQSIVIRCFPAHKPL